MCEGYLYSHSYTKDNSAYSLNQDGFTIDLYRIKTKKTKHQQQVINQFLYFCLPCPP